MADELFNASGIDLDKNQRLDLNEFRSLNTQNIGAGPANFVAHATSGGQYAGSSYESSSSPTYGNVGGANGNYSPVAGGGAANYGSYEQSSYTSTSGVDAGSFDANASSGFDIGGFEASASSGIGLANETTGASSLSTLDRRISQQQIQVSADNPQNLYQDPNPQIIRRAAQGGQLTYTQNIKIRFLQPPPVPPPGPLIIKEVRPPQPPLLPPLRIRQQARPHPQLPPLILRERPPVPPACVAPQTVIRTLKPLPMPPRSVIIERLPPLPPKPRDIIIERWLPYAAVAKRKTIIQRAEPAKEYPKPRNIIIQYEPIQVRIVRQFQRLGITQENPQLYIQRYGISLLDAQTLVQQARAAGVVEDISPPSNAAAAIAASSTSVNAEFNSASSGIETIGGDVDGSTSPFGSSVYGGSQQANAGFSGFESAQAASQHGNASFSSFESAQAVGQQENADFSGFQSAQDAGQQRNASFSGFESAQGAGLAGGFPSSFESSSFSSQNSDAGFGRAQFGGASASGYENYGVSANIFNNNGGDPITAAFIAADLNRDGVLDVNEFRQFLTSHIQ